MRAVMVTKLGGPEVLAVEERPDPVPGPGQIVVEVRAAGVNFMDVYQREGVGPYKKELPFGIGASGLPVDTRFPMSVASCAMVTRKYSR